MGGPVTPRTWGIFGTMLAGAVLVDSCARPPRRPVFPQPPSSPDQVLEVWLAKNCKVGEENDLERSMRRFGPQLTPKLIQAFEKGPPETQTQAIASHAAAELAELQQRVASLRLRPEDARSIMAMPYTAYSGKAVAEFTQAYKSSALAGLGATRTQDAIAYLRAETLKPGSDFQGLTGAILARIGKSPRR